MGRPLRTVHPSMLKMDQNLDSDRQFHGQIRTSDQDYRFNLGEWTDFFTLDRPPHLQIQTYHYKNKNVD